MSITSTKLKTGLCAVIFLSGSAYAQDHSNDDRFKPRVYGNISLTSAPTVNRVIEPVSTTGVTRVIQSSTPTGNYTTSDVEAEAQRVIAFQNASQGYYNQTIAPRSHIESERRYEIELFEPTQIQPSYTTAARPTQSYATHTVSNTQNHLVSDGDTLYNVAKRYNTTVDALRSANSLAGNNIRIGQSITIPSTSRHVIANAPVQTSAYNQTLASAPTSNVIRTVQPVPNRGVYAVLPKDTLYSISKRACVSVKAIQTQNNLGQRTDITPGQRLNMPDGHCLN